MWRAIALLAAVPAWGATVKGDRLTLHFVASPLANLTFELDAMAGLAGADETAYRTLWRRELRWSSEDDWQLVRWKTLRRKEQGGSPEERVLPKVAWPPNYAGFYGQEMGLDQSVRIAGFQARSVDDYGKRLRHAVSRGEADGLVSVIKHFQPRFGEFWEREGRRLTESKTEAFANLVRDRRILELAEQFVVFTEAALGRRHEVWFYLMAHPTRFGKATMATQVRSHAPVELLDEEQPEQKLSVIVHELVHHFYDAAPAERHLELIEEFRRQNPTWRMAAYSYMNEAVATAAGILVERRIRSREDFEKWAADPQNVYGQPWIAALGAGTYPVVERCLTGECSLFRGFAPLFVAAAGEALGARVDHPHFRLASRVVVTENGRLRTASRMFREQVPSIMQATGWEQLDRFPNIPVVILALEAEREAIMERVGPKRDVTVLSGETAEAVERAVEKFARRPF